MAYTIENKLNLKEKVKKGIAKAILPFMFMSSVGFGSAVSKAYAEVQNVKVSGDLTLQGTTHRLYDEKTGESEKAHIFGLPSSYSYLNKKFEYEGKEYVVNWPFIKGNKVVFWTNFDKEGEYVTVETTDKAYITMNPEIFTADLSDDKLTNIKRLTKTKDKFEMGPFWTEDDKIAYTDFNVSDPNNNKYYLMNNEGNILKEISREEWLNLRKEYYGISN